MHDDPGRVQHAAQPRRHPPCDLGARASDQVSRFAAGANVGPGGLERTADRVRDQWAPVLGEERGDRVLAEEPVDGGSSRKGFVATRLMIERHRRRTEALVSGESLA